MSFQIGDIVYDVSAYDNNNLVYGMIVECTELLYNILFLYDDECLVENSYEGDIVYYNKNSVDLLENLK
jgi:hypothetical protein